MTRTEETIPSVESDNISDVALVEATRQGESTAYAELWRRHYPSALAASRAIVDANASVFDADDLAQEAFAAIFTAISRGGGPTAGFRPYLMTAIRNTSMNWGRLRREIPDDNLDTVAASAWDDTDAQLDRSLTHTAFRKLPTRWQEVLWYTEVEQMKPAAVGPLLGLSAAAVSQLAFRAREGLREAWIQAHLQSLPQDSDCAWVAERLGAYSLRTASRRETTRVREHLDDCARCVIVAAEAGEVSSRLALVLLPLLLGVGGGSGYLAFLQGVPVSASLAMGSVAPVSGSTVGAGAAGTAGASGGSGVAASAGGGAGAAGAGGSGGAGRSGGSGGAGAGAGPGAVGAAAAAGGVQGLVAVAAFTLVVSAVVAGGGAIVSIQQSRADEAAAAAQPASSTTNEARESAGATERQRVDAGASSDTPNPAPNDALEDAPQSPPQQSNPQADVPEASAPSDADVTPEPERQPIVVPTVEPEPAPIPVAPEPVAPEPVAPEPVETGPGEAPDEPEEPAHPESPSAPAAPGTPGAPGAVDGPSTEEVPEPNVPGAVVEQPEQGSPSETQPEIIVADAPILTTTGFHDHDADGAHLLGVTIQGGVGWTATVTSGGTLLVTVQIGEDGTAAAVLPITEDDILFAVPITVQYTTVGVDAPAATVSAFDLYLFGA